MTASATIRVSSSPGEQRIALVDAAGLRDLRIWRPGRPDRVGELHCARVIAAVPAMAGTFVALADAEAFLPDSENPARAGAGAYLAVRITRAAQGGKGPRVSARVQEIAASGPPRRLAPGISPLAELAGAHPAAAIVVDSLALHAELVAALPGRARCQACAFDAALEDEVAALGEPVADLPGGLSAIFSPTPALTAIDIDAGAATAARAPKAQAQFAANRAALPALARQIRLRNLGGAILIDFAGMAARRRVALAPELAAALAADPLQPRLIGFSGLGFAEIRRPRIRPPLHELLAGPHAEGLAALRDLVRRHPADADVGLRAAPVVIEALRADPVAMAAARHHTRHLHLIADPALPNGAWRLETPRAG